MSWEIAGISRLQRVRNDDINLDKDQWNESESKQLWALAVFPLTSKWPFYVCKTCKYKRTIYKMYKMATFVGVITIRSRCSPQYIPLLGLYDEVNQRFKHMLKVFR